MARIYVLRSGETGLVKAAFDQDMFDFLCGKATEKREASKPMVGGWIPRPSATDPTGMVVMCNPGWFQRSHIRVYMHDGDYIRIEDDEDGKL
jgi:hypothetical protein